MKFENSKMRKLWNSPAMRVHVVFCPSRVLLANNGTYETDGTDVSGLHSSPFSLEVKRWQWGHCRSRAKRQHLNAGLGARTSPFSLEFRDLEK